MLQFNEPTPSAAAPTNIPKASDLPPDQYFLNVDKLIKEETESQEAKQRSQIIIQMCRRYRGSTPSDLFGFWRNGVWADSPKFSNLHSTNVFQSLIHGAESGFSQARISLDISAKAGNFQNKSVEKIARSIYEVINREQWNDLNHSALFFSAILKLNAYAITRFNRSGGPQVPMPQFSQMDYQQGGMSICPDCYGHQEYLPGESCYNCGNPDMHTLQEPQQMQDQVVSQFGQVDAGEAELVIADGLDVSVDDRAGKSADIKSAAWVQWRYFAQKGELQKLYQHLKLEKKPEWAYNTRLKVALKRYESGEAMPKSKLERSQYEVRQTWIDRAEYEGYVAPSSFQLGNFSIEQGERLCDKCPDGVVMGVINNELAFIDNEDKNRRVKSCLWLADPTSFYGLGARAGLSIQKKINQLDNMAMEGEARSMKGALIYDPEAIDGAHLEGANTNIPLKPGFSAGGSPLKSFIMPVDVSGLSQASLMFLQAQTQEMKSIMGIPDVSLGQADTNIKTATGQQIVAARAAGLLIPAKQSEGALKVGWLRDQLDVIQRFYSPEALIKFGSRYGDEWQPDEIQAFLSCKLDDSITIDMVDGSEVPETRFEKQQKLRQDVMAGLIPVTPLIQSKLIQQAGYDGIDVGDYQSNEKLAQKRYAFLQQATQDPRLEQAYQMAEQAMVDKKTGQRLTDPSGNPVTNPLVTQILQAPVLQTNKQAENQQQQFEFWADRIRQLLGSGTQVSQVLVACCDAMATIAKLNGFQQTMQANTLTSMTQMPAAGGAQIQNHALMPPEPTNNSQNNSK
jgi:hypothetical protein